MHAKSTVFYLTHLILTINVTSVICKAAPKIIGGHPVSIKHRPFMLSLHGADGFICGASILSRDWGITALHCLLSEGANYFVRAGSNRLDQGGSLHRVTKMHAYNDSTYQYWFSGMLYHDIALFEVRPRFRFSSRVRSVRLPRESSKPPRELYVCGWGYTGIQSSPTLSSILRGVSVTHTPYETCVNETPDYTLLVKRENHLCYGTHGKDSCYGDSGGPLASKTTLYGIVSFGYNCAIVSGIYENISYYRRWIKQITNL
ncbi:trypsin 3A1 [Xylocopa sonorina]|uniref:trypsin 3A1 n=1 Tax=Xylocopa sonorina TaxID=1818115 RepID=UPI00403A8BEF